MSKGRFGVRQVRVPNPKSRIFGGRYASVLGSFGGLIASHLNRGLYPPGKGRVPQKVSRSNLVFLWGTMGVTDVFKLDDLPKSFSVK